MKYIKYIVKKYLFIWIGLGFAVLSWLGESAIHSFLLHQGSFPRQFLSPNPHEAWMRLLIFVLFIALGLYAQLAFSSQLKKENRIAHLNAILGAIRNVNQLIVRVTDRETLIWRVCEHLIETRGYHNAWIALHDQSQTFTVFAEAGLGEGFQPVRRSFESGVLPDCAREAMERLEIVIVPEPLSHCTVCPLAPQYRGRSGMCIRLEYHGRRYGILAVSAPAGAEHDVEEQNLFREVAEDIALALDNLEMEEQKMRADLILKEREERLRHAEKLATIGELARAMAHEIKNPLFAISSGIQVLETQLNLAPEQKQTFRIIFKEIMRVDRLVKQLLAFSGRSELRISPQHLDNLISEVISLNQGLLLSRGVRAETLPSPNMPLVPIDKDKIEQVILNLLQNAIDVSRAGDTIEISCSFDRERKLALLRIEDMGPGVSEDDREKIFNPFFSTKKGSTGMGLTISRKIVLDHGGDIRIEPRANGGSTFLIELPLTHDPVPLGS